MPPQFPPFDSLPIDKLGPPYNAWGLYGPDDELGRLNLITPESVKRGKNTITEGIAINLKVDSLPLSFFPAHASRKRLEHNMWGGVESVADIPMTTSSRSIPRHRLNGTVSDITHIKTGRRRDNTDFVRHPITSRAHLLDIPSHLSTHSLPPLSPFSPTSSIPLPLLKACAAESNIHFLPGDILLVRTGFAEAIGELGEEEREGLRGREVNGSCGVGKGEDVWRWHWENGIAAVASDCPSYENWPTPSSQLTSHQIFLAGWGLPIGELFKLDELAQKCRELGRWTFMFTSMPLFVEGGVASPPNAQAIL
ncbi:hypothetical protein B9479_005604 [Cryptococcus floricola]|uniref:Cyclase n=1 Tax=Cryptococcus floricola TaxID=2591691 RepID=A0A5D3AST7_9TREE|nr:hypothetical protein B9479_005604 [Cryptococcus floricola]